MSGCVAWKLHTERGGLYGGYLDQSEMYLTQRAEICVFLLLLNLELNESVVVVDNLFGCSTRSSFKSKPENLLPANSPFYLLVSLSGSSFSLEVMFSINDTALQFSIRSWKSDYKLRSASQSNRRRSLNINSRVSDCSLNDMFGLKGEDCLIS